METSDRSSDTWRRVEDLFHEALRRSPDERRGFVERRCGDDPALCEEVLSLLYADTSRAAALDDPPVELLAPSPTVQATIGPYRILAELGRGGGGVVYLAERADGEFRRRVAIKLLAHGFDTERLRRRLCAERQILADLEHPNIAQLYEGGSTDDGRPYLVMEHVDGEPIDDHCRRLDLSVRRRIELFLEVCAAVHFAHENHVVHRDLKPSNVLVGRDGEPRLLDFGIAKILHGAASPESMDTTVGPAPMTFLYASPEQIRGGPVNRATDVYALGVMLYELLVGERPLEPDSGLDARWLRRVCEEEPVKPSRAIRRRIAGRREPRPDEARRLARRLEGDLDAIVLTALRKEPESRYATVKHLADDLDGHLRGLPVRARRASVVYRTGKLLRRHARPAVAAALVIVALGGFTVDRTLQHEQADRARERAEAAASHLAELVLYSSDTADKARTLVPREVLEWGAAFLPELDDRPELRADLLTSLGRGYLALGSTDEAEPFLEGALAARRQLRGPDDPGLVTELSDLAWLRTDQGRSLEAEALYRRVVAMEGGYRGPEHPAVASARNALAASLLDQGRYAEAEPVLRNALAIQRELLGDDDPRVAAIAGNLAAVLYYRGRYPEAAEVFRQVLDALRRRMPEDESQVAAAKINLAAALRSEGSYAEAEALLLEVLALHQASPATPALGPVLENLAKNDLYRGQMDAARRRATEAVEVYHRFYDGDHPSLARAEVLLGRVLLENGRREEAEPVLRRAIAVFRAGQLADHWQEAEAESLLGACLLARGRTAEAEPLLRSSYRRIREQVGDEALPSREAAERLARLETVPPPSGARLARHPVP